MLILERNEELESIYFACLGARLNSSVKTLRDVYNSVCNIDEEKRKSRRIDANTLGRILRILLKETITDAHISGLETEANVICFLKKYVCLSYDDLAKIKDELTKKKSKNTVLNKIIQFLKSYLADYLYDELIKGVSLNQINAFHDDLVQLAEVKKDVAYVELINSFPSDAVLKKYAIKNTIKLCNLILKTQKADTCIYCNGQSIDNRDENIVAQLDHMFAKSIYPHFAVCLYNLVPSCPTCNKIKLAEDKDFQSPYDTGYSLDYFKFCLDFDTHMLTDTENFELRFKVGSTIYSKEDLEKMKSREPIVENLIQMKIAAFYTNRRKEAAEILEKHNWYVNAWTKTLMEIDQDIDIKKELYGSIPEDHELKLRPYSKYKRDLMENVEIIEKKRDGGYKFL